MRRELENPHIIVINDTLRNKDDVLPLLQAIASLPPEDRQVLIVADDIVTDAMSLLVINNLKGFAGIAVCKVPDKITNKTEYLKDLAVSCGAKVLSLNTGHSVLDPDTTWFGRAEKVIVEPTETVIINGQASEEDWTAHKAELQTYLKDKDPSVRKFAEDRMQTLSQKVLSISVGGQSEAEAEERHYRYEDAVGASRAALRGGWVPGGGTLLLAISQDFTGALRKALEAPINEVYTNAGITPHAEDKFEVGFGYDVLRPEDGMVKLAERGIVDPAESEIEAVRTAVSIAGLLLTAGAMVVEEVTDEKAPELPRLNQG